LNQQKS